MAAFLAVLPEVLMGVGAVTLAGGGTMYALRKKDDPGKKASKDPTEKKEEPVVEITKEEVVVVDDDKPKYTVFGVNTYHLRERAPIYVHLHNLNTYVQFKPERDAFSDLVRHVDNLEFFAKMVKAKDRKLSEIAVIPFVAKEAMTAALSALTAVVEEQELARPSPTKKAAMDEIAHSITSMLKKAVHNIRVEVASCPVEVTSM